MRERPAPAPKVKSKRKGRGEEELEDRELTRSEKEAMQRHRSVAPWLYIAAHIIRMRWVAPPPLSDTENGLPQLELISGALRSWAATEELGEQDQVTNTTKRYEEADIEALSGRTVNAQLFACVYTHVGATVKLITLGAHSFVIPPRSSFLLSHSSFLAPLLSTRPASGYSLIVADPPWENASARRAAVYASLAPHQLRALPVASLVGAHAYIAIWVTNKEDLIRFACKTLLPAWGASHVATLLWLKVTCTGELVCPIDPERAQSAGMPHRPYETLVVGRVGSASADVEALEARLLQSRVIVSDAGRRHSRKPSLDELFRPLLSALLPTTQVPACLEMFARELRSGWVSWGNEVLLFQERTANFE